MIKAWTETEPFVWNGKYTQLRYVNTWPRPLQKPHPPVWIPGGGSIETWEWVVEQDYLFAYLSYAGYKRAQTVMDTFWNYVKDAGKDMATRTAPASCSSSACRRRTRRPRSCTATT